MSIKFSILFAASNAGLKDEAAIAAKAGISEDRLNEIFSGSAMTLPEAYRLSLALEVAVSRIVDMALRDASSSSEDTSDSMKKVLSGEDPERLLSLFVNQKIIEFNGDLYLVSRPGVAGTRIRDACLPKIADALMRHGNLKTVRAHDVLVKSLPLHSLEDLDVYGEEMKEGFLFYTLSKDFTLCDVGLPYYFIPLMNHLPQEEAKGVLKEVERRVANIASFAKDALDKGGRLEVLGNFFHLVSEDGAAFIHKSYSPNLMFEDESMNHIRQIEDELSALANKN